MENQQPIITLPIENLRKHNQGQKIHRFFGCRNCVIHFWRTVFELKPVARCVICRIKLDAIPREYEYGKGTFKCDGCDNIWTSHPAEHHVSQPCQRCGKKDIKPHKIGPNRNKGPRRSRRRHMCEKCSKGNCDKHIRVFSTFHISTGSTITDLSSLQSGFSSLSIYKP